MEGNVFNTDKFEEENKDLTSKEKLEKMRNVIFDHLDKWQKTTELANPGKESFFKKKICDWDNWDAEDTQNG